MESGIYAPQDSTSRLCGKGHDMEAKKRFIVNIMFYGIIIALVLLVCKYVLPILVPFIIAFCVAALLQIPIRRMNLKRSGVRKMVSIVLCSVFYVLVFLLLLSLGMRLVTEAGGLLSSIPGLFTNVLVPLLQQLADNLETAASQYDPQLASLIDQAANSAMKTVGEFVTSSSASALRMVTGVATGVPGLLVKVIITVISTFFILLDYDKVIGVLRSMVPSGKRELVGTGIAYTRKMVTVYIKSYALLFLLTLVELSIGFTILRIPYAAVLALVISVFDLMPILGVGGILLPWALVLLAMGNLPLAAGIAALYLIITAVRQTLEPRLVGQQIGLHPLATLIAMLLGLGLFGIVGMFAFPVTLAVFMAMRRNKPDAA